MSCKYLTSPFKNFKNLYTQKIREKMNKMLNRAFSLWSEVCPLTFAEKKKKDNVDITFAFYKGDHGDGFPFQSPAESYTNGHTFSFKENRPSRVHFNSDFAFIHDPKHKQEIYTGKNDEIFSTALHEIGHALGVDHVSDPNSIMVPQSSKYMWKLSPFDIGAIQKIYGPNINAKRKRMHTKASRRHRKQRVVRGNLGEKHSKKKHSKRRVGKHSKRRRFLRSKMRKRKRKSQKGKSKKLKRKNLRLRRRRHKY